MASDEIGLDNNGNGVYSSGGGASSSHHDGIERKALLDSDDSSADSNDEWMRKYMSVGCKDEQWPCQWNN